MGAAGGNDRRRKGEPVNDVAPRKRSVVIAGHRTSISLEQPFWDALAEIATRRGVSANALIAEIDRGRSGNLSSAIRIFVLEEARRARQ